jgi:hypothetical protein
MSTERIALSTTVYPAALPYLRAWYASVLRQTDRDFDLWVAADGLTPAEVAAAVDAPLNAPLRASWVSAEPGDTPTTLRARAMAILVRRYPAVVFVDSDDVLEPTRVAAARQALEECDVTGCGLRLVDATGGDLGVVLAPATSADATAQLPMWNVFGLSNSAYRTSLLERCLPVPAETELVDWYLATAAWGHGARMHFDTTPRMRYRQHAGNMARVLPPFTPAYVRRATSLVERHHEAVRRGQSLPAAQGERVERAASRVSAFRRWTETSPGALTRYGAALHQLPTVHAWWWCVAHPDLEAMWSSS